MNPLDNAMPSLSVDWEPPPRSNAGAPPAARPPFGLPPPGDGPVFVTTLPCAHPGLLPSPATIRAGHAGLLALPQTPEGEVTHVILNDPDRTDGVSGLVMGIEPTVVHDIAIRLAGPTRAAARLLDAEALTRALAPGEHRAVDAAGALALRELPLFLRAPGAADPDRPQAHYTHAADILQRAAARTLLALAGVDAARLERRDGAVSVDRACGFMIAYIAEPLILDDLLRATDVSARSLQYAFQARHGTGPMQWLREQRLRRLHASLASAPRGMGVTELATAAGFTHLGRLGGVFRRRFGLRPHEMLGRRPRR